MVVVVALVARILSWPGYATQDTLFIADDALRGVYTTYHPLLNALLMRALVVPFDTFAVYTSMQIVLCSGLFLRALWLVVPVGGRGWTAVAGALVWALSLSTVLYLGMLWKDVLVGYTLAYIAALAYRVRRDDVRSLHALDVALLGVSLSMAVTLRHGMAFNLVLVPLLLGPRRVLAHRGFWAPCVVAALLYAGLAMASRSSFVDNDAAHYQRLKIAAVAQPFLSIVSSPNGYTSDDPGYDAALAGDVFGPDYAKAYTADYFKNVVQPGDAATLSHAYRAIVLRTPRLCLLNIARCLSGRVEMALATLQPSTAYGAMRFYDLGAMGDCATRTDLSPGGCAALRRLSQEERPAMLTDAVRSITTQWVKPKDAVSNLLLWNLVPAAALALLVLLTRRAGDALWLATGFIVVQAALPFATAMANDFRYYYFLSLYFALFLPLAAGLAVRWARQAGTRWPHVRAGR